MSKKQRKVTFARIAFYLVATVLGLFVSIPIAKDIHQKNVDRLERFEEISSAAKKIPDLIHWLGQPERKSDLTFILLFIWLEFANFAARWLFSPFIPDAIEAIEGLGELLIGDLFPSIPSIVVGLLMLVFGGISLKLFLGTVFARACLGMLIKSLKYA
ncbi:MAG: hypothetical protein ACPGFB_11120 [Verrucomicrobiales bacterium]